MHIRHHSLYTPRDFDVSPFFDIVKPTIETGFDYKQIEWADQASPPVVGTEPAAVPWSGPPEPKEETR
jgi:hypothetical protein